MQEPEEIVDVVRMVDEAKQADTTGIAEIDHDNRMVRVWQLRIRGLTTMAIAKALGISVSTVYSDLKEVGRRYREELLKVDPVTIVAENMQWLDEMERIALYELHQASTQKQKVIDAATGATTEVEIQDPNKSRFYLAALQARKMRLDLLIQTGIIPRERANLFDALEQSATTEAEKGRERSVEEIRADIERLMKHGRTLK